MESFLRDVDSRSLKAKLNKIMTDLDAVTADAAVLASAQGNEEAGERILEFSEFFVATAEHYGTTPHAVVGQHVVTNVLVFVLDRIVKPNLAAYCRVAEKHAANALLNLARSAPTSSSSHFARPGCATSATPASSANAIASGSRDALEARRRRLRSAIIRPFTQLFQSLHTSLVSNGEPLTSWREDRKENRTTKELAEGVGGGIGKEASWGAPNSTLQLPSFQSFHADNGYGAAAAGERMPYSSSDGVDDDEDALIDDGGCDSLCQVPLLWKNASPLNIVCNHILEVLESQWLVAAVGADYASLLLEVLRWAGYARLVTPSYLLRISKCLVTLIERVSTGADEERSAGDLAVSFNLVARETTEGRAWIARPNADDACLYAQALGRLYALPQVSYAYPPSLSSSEEGKDDAAMTAVHRVMELIKERHRYPTPDLRLEAYCIAALRHLCERLQHDHTKACRAPIEVVKLLCDFFFLPQHTPRHDVWRLEVMQFITVVLSGSLCDVLGDDLWHDLQRQENGSAFLVAHRCETEKMDDWMHADEGAGKPFHKTEFPEQLRRHVPRRLLFLLHQTVFPTMHRIFTQYRHEYSFISRRELFSFPCSPLQDVFDFGAVVLYVCSVTHSEYVKYAPHRPFADPLSHLQPAVIAIDGAEERTPAGGLHACDAALRYQRKRSREAVSGEDDRLLGGIGRGGAQAERSKSVGGAGGDADHAPKGSTHHPVDTLVGALQHEFFMPCVPQDSAISGAAPSIQTTQSTHSPECKRKGRDEESGETLCAATRRRAGAAPLTLRVGIATACMSRAATLDAVSDTALFSLHLLAQPCATLHATPTTLNRLVEDVLLPLHEYLSLRLGPLLLAVLRSILPRCTASTQHYAFAVLSQSSFPPAAPTRTLGVLVHAVDDAAGGGGAGYNDLRSSSMTISSETKRNFLTSAPVYNVLVRILEEHLHQRGSPPHSGISAGVLCFGLQLSWAASHRAIVQSVYARLSEWEYTWSGLCRRNLAAATMTVAAVDEGPSKLDASRLTYTPTLIAQPALTLLRFATLLQCVRLWQLSAPSVETVSSKPSVGSPTHQHNVLGVSGLWDFTTIFKNPLGSCRTELHAACSSTLCEEHGGGRFRDDGLSFVTCVTAHATSFYDGVPFLTSVGRSADPEDARGTTRLHTSRDEQSIDFENENVAMLGNRGDAWILRFCANSTSCAPRSSKPFSASLFAEWLDMAEMYAGAALRICAAREQLERHVLQLSCTSASSGESGGAGFSSSLDKTAVPQLQGAVKQEVVGFLDDVGDRLDRVGTDSTMTTLPTTLYDAVEPCWILRLSSRRRAVPREYVGAPFSCPVNDQSAMISPEEGELAKMPNGESVARIGRVPAIPGSFRMALMSSVQESFLRLLRRAQLLRGVALYQSEAQMEKSSAGTDVGERSRRSPHLQAASSGETELSAIQSTVSAALLLDVQCVQLLHLLLRWRRAALWVCPTEESLGQERQRTGKDAMKDTQGRKKDSATFGSRCDPATSSRDAASGCAAEPQVVSSSGDFDSTEKSDDVAAMRADLELIRTAPDLFATPLRMLGRFSIVGGGRLYYIILWLCQHLHASLRRQTEAIVTALPLWTALRIMFRDVGTILLDPAFACLDPGQTILRFTAMVTSRALEYGVRTLSRWRPSNTTSREGSSVVTAGLRISTDVLRRILWISARTGVAAYAVDPLVDVPALSNSIISVMRAQTLFDSESLEPRAKEAGEDFSAAVQNDTVLPSQHPLLNKLPFLLPLLPALPVFLRTLTLLCCIANSSSVDVTSPGFNRYQTVVQLLQILFSRYRYQLGPSLCDVLLRGVVAEAEHFLQLQPSLRCGSLVSPASGLSGKGAVGDCQAQRYNTEVSLYVHAGRLLEHWTRQLTDTTRVDMPVCTLAWNRALLRTAFTVLPRCEPAVAEELGRFSFEFLSESTPYAERCYAARQVGVLFHIFSTRRMQVLRTLLTKARESMLSDARLLCSTSLLALSEAVRAASEVQVEVIYTLLECWSMRGFHQHNLLMECLQRMTAWVLDDAHRRVMPLGHQRLPRVLPFHYVCEIHVRSLLFLWLCESRHPLTALPVRCFGVTSLKEFSAQHMGELVPLALLLMTLSNDFQWAANSAANYRKVGFGQERRPDELMMGGETFLRREGGELYHQLTELYSSSAFTRASALQVAPAGAESCLEECRVSKRTKDDKRDEADELPIEKGDSCSVADGDGDGVENTVLLRHRPLRLLLDYYPSTVAQLLVLASHTSRSLFSGSDQGLSGAIEKGSGDEVGSGFHHPDESCAAITWATAAQRSLYWLEMQLNTCASSVLASCLRPADPNGKKPPGDDVEAITGTSLASLLKPDTALNSTAVLLFYLRHCQIWPVARSFFDLVLASRVDAILKELVRLHRMPLDPQALVYGTSEQLRRALRWVAEKLVLIPIALPLSNAGSLCSRDNKERLAVYSQVSHTHTSRSGDLQSCVVVDSTTTREEINNPTGVDVAAVQAHCLALLVPGEEARRGEQGLLVSGVTVSHNVDEQRTSDGRTTDQVESPGTVSEDALTQFFLLRGSTFLHALLHCAYSFVSTPSSVEMALRTPQQLLLLTHIATKWCSARVLSNPLALRLILTHLLPLLGRFSAPFVHKAVSDSLLHIWSVAQTGGGHGVVGAPLASAQMQWCARMLSHAIVPLSSFSPLMASTWNALCRKDPNLMHCDWQRRVREFLDGASQRGTIPGRLVAHQKPEEEGDGCGLAVDASLNRSCGVIEVEDITGSDTDEASDELRLGEDGVTANRRECEDDAKCVTVPLVTGVHRWSWDTYNAHRKASLSPLCSAGTRARLEHLLIFLRHVGGLEGEVPEWRTSINTAGGGAERHAKIREDVASNEVQLFQWFNRDEGSTAPPPLASFLQDLTIAVDDARELLVRCVEVAVVCRRAGMDVAPPLRLDATSSAISPTNTLQEAEMMALAIRAVLLSCARQLYQWCFSGEQETSLYGSATTRIPGELRFRDTVAGAFHFRCGEHPTLPVDEVEARFLAAFQLLRAVSLCVIQGGESEALPLCIARKTNGFCITTAHTDSPQGGHGACELGMGYAWRAEDSDMPGMGLREATTRSRTAEDVVARALGGAYGRQLRVLEGLVWDEDSDLSELAMRALRIWTWCCGTDAEFLTSIDGMSVGERLTNFDSAIVQLMSNVWKESFVGLPPLVAFPQGGSASDPETLRTAGGELHGVQAVRFIRQSLAWVLRSSEERGHPREQRSFHETSALTLSAAPSSPSSHRTPLVSLTNPSVWQPLRANPPNEHAFLCRFILAAAHTYGLFKKSTLWTSLVPLLREELRGAEKRAGAATSETSMSGELDSLFTGMEAFEGGRVRFAEHLVHPLFLHLLCLREGDSQRVIRRTWSLRLDQDLFQRAGECRYAARLFLHALHQCHVVLLHITRQRGLKGSRVVSGNRDKVTTETHIRHEDPHLVSQFSGPQLWIPSIGAVPSLTDMCECYWLSDIPAMHLARAAVQVREPHLALLFSQLSGESLFGPRTGAAALCGETETTRSIIEARAGSSTARYSVLFPFAEHDDYSSPAAARPASKCDVRTRSGGRARERFDAVRQQVSVFAQELFDVYAAAQRQIDVDDVVGVSVMTIRPERQPLGRQVAEGLPSTQPFSGASGRTVIRRCEQSVSHGAAPMRDGGAGVGKRRSPTTSSEWLDNMQRLEEQEARERGCCAHRQGDIFQNFNSEMVPCGTAKRQDRDVFTSEAPFLRDPWATHLQRAALLLRQGFASAALDVLLGVQPPFGKGDVRAPWSDDSVAPQQPPLQNQHVEIYGAQRSADIASPHMDDTTLSMCDAQQSGHTAAGPGARNSAAPTAVPSGWSPTHEATLQSLLAEAAWRCGRWSPSLTTDPISGSSQPGCVRQEVLDRLSHPWMASFSPSTEVRSSAAVGGGLYTHLLHAFVALSSRQPRLCLQHIRRAESSLCAQLSSTTILPTVMAAEALNEVREYAHFVQRTLAADHRDCAAFKLPLQPFSDEVAPQLGSSHREGTGKKGRAAATRLRWSSRAAVANVPLTLHYAACQLVDSVRHALCQVSADNEGWYRFMLDATERALVHDDAPTAQRWLSDWEEGQRADVMHSQRTCGDSGDEIDDPAAAAVLQNRRLDVLLRKAQITYGLGRWQEAFAILQPSPVSETDISMAAGQSMFRRPAPRLAPLEPRVIQQLMVWHGELQLVPPSQLVRDHFLSRAATSDTSGACSFLLARLCHTLADEIATRRTSYEYHQLRESVEESKRLKAELQTQLEDALRSISPNAPAEPHGSGTRAVGNTSRAVRTAAPPGPAAFVAPEAGLSEDQLRVIRRRIRELSGDIKRLEDEWEGEMSNYALYRRSALNAYSRFLQFNATTAASMPNELLCHDRQHEEKGTVRPLVRSLPANSGEDVVHALFGFVELWLNVTDMGSMGGGDSDCTLDKVVAKAVERIPTASFLPLAGQLVAQLDTSRQGGERLLFLVTRIARDYPLHVVWPLLALSHGRTFDKSKEAHPLVYVDEAKARTAQRLLSQLATPPETPSALPHRSREPSPSCSTVATQVQQAQLLSAAYLELAFDRSAATAQVDKRHSIRKNCMLLKDAHHLMIQPPTSLDLFATPAPSASALGFVGPGWGTGNATLDMPHVLRYRDYFTTPGGVNVPKVLRCELSDGQVVRQLLKAGDDLRQDALIEQVFSTANHLLLSRAATRPLRICTFTIIPLAPQAGILQWVEHTIPLGEYLTGKMAGKEMLPGAHERYFPGELTSRECRVQLQSAPPSSKCQTLLELYGKFTPALHYFFLEEYASAQVWVDRQQAFTRSVATSSMIGYVVGLGDRHINNILLHTQTADVVHIDLGIAFDQNRLLPVPELVPFRLTRNVIDGLGVRGTEGSLRPCAEAAMQLLREKRELLRTILTSIMHDPLARWAIGAPGRCATTSGASFRDGDGGITMSDTHQPAPMRTRASNADAARTLARIDAKLRGMDGGDVLSVPTHVRKLIEEAQKVESLAVMFPGWSQWV